MTRSQKILLSSFALFILAIAGFQMFLLFGASKWPLALDLALGFAMGVVVKQAGFCFFGLLILPLLVAILAVGPGALFTESAEARLGVGLLVVFGLVAYSVGTLFGYLVRRFISA